MKGLAVGYVRVLVEKLVRAPWNYKQEDAEREAVLEKSLHDYHQMRVLNVREREDGLLEVLDGNHRLDAVRKLGWKEVVVYNHGPISKNEAARLSIELNETRFPVNYAKLAYVIKDIADIQGWEEINGSLIFSQEQYEQLQGYLEDTWHPVPALDKSVLPSEGEHEDYMLLEFSMPASSYAVVRQELDRIIAQYNLTSKEHAEGEALVIIAQRSASTPRESVL